MRRRIRIHKQAMVTVVLYRRMKVVNRFGFRSKELDDDGTRRVLAGIKRLLDES